MRRNPINGEAAAEALRTRRFPARGEAVPKGLKGFSPTHVIPAEATAESGDLSGFAEKGLGLG